MCFSGSLSQASRACHGHCQRRSVSGGVRLLLRDQIAVNPDCVDRSVVRCSGTPIPSLSGWKNPQPIKRDRGGDENHEAPSGPAPAEVERDDQRRQRRSPRAVVLEERSAAFRSCLKIPTPSQTIGRQSGAAQPPSPLNSRAAIWPSPISRPSPSAPRGDAGRIDSAHRRAFRSRARAASAPAERCRASARRGSGRSGRGWRNRHGR